jgi:hypothetical protein
MKSGWQRFENRDLRCGAGFREPRGAEAGLANDYQSQARARFLRPEVLVLVMEQSSMTIHHFRCKFAGDVGRIWRCLRMTSRLEPCKDSIEAIGAL